VALETAEWLAAKDHKNLKEDENGFGSEQITAWAAR